MRIFLCFLFSCLIFTTTAQQNVVEKYIGWKWRDSKMKVFSNGQNTCALILRRDSIKAVLLDNNQHFVKDFSVSTHSLVMNCSGGFIKGDNIYIYFEDLHNDDLHAVAINTQTGVVTEKVISVNLKKNKLLSRISSASHFIYFTVNKKSDDFVIYDFKDETHFDTIHFEANPHMWKSLRYKTESWGPSAINVVRIDTDGKQKYETLSCLHKLYFRDNNLLLLSSTLTGTLVTEFDLISKQMTPHIIQHTTDKIGRAHV